MNRLLSILFSIAGFLLPFIRSSRWENWCAGITLILSNGVLAVGVVFLGWSPWGILFVYWAESVFIGVLNVLKLLSSGAINEKGRFSVPGTLAGIGMSVFFTLHYGLFMLGHLVFLVFFYGVLTAGSFENSGKALENILNNPEGIGNFFGEAFGFRGVAGFFDSELFALALILASHLVAFFLGYVKNRIYAHRTTDSFMTDPYRRVFVMQIAIIFGGGVLMALRDRGQGLFAVWIAVKIIADLKGLFSEGEKDNAALPKAA